MGFVPPKPSPMPSDPRKRADWYSYWSAVYRRGEAGQRRMFGEGLATLGWYLIGFGIVALAVMIWRQSQ